MSSLEWHVLDGRMDGSRVTVGELLSIGRMMMTRRPRMTAAAAEEAGESVKCFNAINKGEKNSTSRQNKNGDRQ